MNFGTVAILGPGLIGGSLALALAERGLADRLVIYARSPHALDAIRLAGVDAELTGNPERGGARGRRGHPLRADRGHGRAGRRMPRRAQARRARHRCRQRQGQRRRARSRRCCDGRALWIGSHPMAGSEQSGFVAARPDLFENAAVILTPTAQTAPGALDARGDILEGARRPSLHHGARRTTTSPSPTSAMCRTCWPSLLVANANPDKPAAGRRRLSRHHAHRLRLAGIVDRNPLGQPRRAGEALPRLVAPARGNPAPLRQRRRGRKIRIVQTAGKCAECALAIDGQEIVLAKPAPFQP